MKYVIFVVLLTSFFPMQSWADTVTHKADDVSEVVAKRLESKSLKEVVQIALKLQMECQAEVNEDVCNGVNTILAVVKQRLMAARDRADDKTIAFVEGLIEGVYEANRNTMKKMSE